MNHNCHNITKTGLCKKNYCILWTVKGFWRIWLVKSKNPRWSLVISFHSLRDIHCWWRHRELTNLKSEISFSSNQIASFDDVVLQLHTPLLIWSMFFFFFIVLCFLLFLLFFNDNFYQHSFKKNQKIALLWKFFSHSVNFLKLVNCYYWCDVSNESFSSLRSVGSPFKCQSGQSLHEGKKIETKWLLGDFSAWK